MITRLHLKHFNLEGVSAGREGDSTATAENVL